jgi:hypothetical protein
MHEIIPTTYQTEEEHLLVCAQACEGIWAWLTPFQLIKQLSATPTIPAQRTAEEIAL